MESFWRLSSCQPGNAEGFCIYNDIGIAIQQLRKAGILKAASKVLIIDIDAHHGNGNAYTFMEDNNITLIDIYNKDIYPFRSYSKKRVNINLPIPMGTPGTTYLATLREGLSELNEKFDLAFVIAGTDVITSDPLGGLQLSIEQCVERDAQVAHKLKELSIPFVFLGGGGYSKESFRAIALSLKNLAKQGF